MPDPVLNRPMFQGSTPSAPSAKGTGITSMVTPPDVAAEQLRSIVNPMKPIVQGFADGGPATSMWQRFVQSLTVPEPDRSGTYRLPDVGLRMGQNNAVRREAGIRSVGSAPEYIQPIETGGREPIDIGGREAVISPEVYADVTRPTMEERRAEAKRNIESYEAPPPNSTPFGRRLQSLFGQDEAGVAAAKQQAQEVSDAALARDEALKKREQLRAEYERATNQNPVSVSDYFSDMSDAELAQKREDRRIAQEAIMRQARPEEYIARGDSNPADLGGAGIRSLRGTGQLPPVVNIDEGKKTEPQRQATSDVGLNLQQIKADREAKSSADRRENALLALMNAGFAMAAGKSPHALQNIGAGGQAGVQAFAEMEKGRRDSEYRQAMQDLHERELRMRQAEQDIKAPLYKAQAAYWTARPDIEADKIAAAERRIVSRAEAEAQKAVDSLEAKNPMVFMGPNGKVDTIAKEAAKAKYLAQYKRQYEDYYKAGVPNAGGGLGLDLPGME